MTGTGSVRPYICYGDGDRKMYVAVKCSQAVPPIRHI